ncbi:UNVERIFIED_CONTAM: protein disulfide isomerase-like 5-4 [Sesamum latifolium]|uniref:Protein disulfide isomerase-like 5-4 n=1 Tax=Sesamum latifolium TaxID=2727402 RepID=A0AAW2WR45_9LAMI
MIVLVELVRERAQPCNGDMLRRKGIWTEYIDLKMRRIYSRPMSQFLVYSAKALGPILNAHFLILLVSAILSVAACQLYECLHTAAALSSSPGITPHWPIFNGFSCNKLRKGMELNDYLRVSTSTSIVVDKSSDGEFLRIDFNISFPALSCEFASIDVSDVLGTNRLNITKTVRKYSIDSKLNPTGSEFRSGAIAKAIKHDEEADEEYGEGSVTLNARNFDRISHQNHIQGYPSIRIFRKGSDVREDHGHHDHESYYGDRDTDSLVKTMEELVAPISLQSQSASGSPPADMKDDSKRPAPLAGGCRIEGFVRVKKVPGNLIISARSASHSFDATQMNMSHITPRVMSDVKRLLPHLGGSHDRLNGLSYISNPSDSNANVTIEHYLQVVKTEVMKRSYKLVEEHEYTAHSSLIHSLDILLRNFILSCHRCRYSAALQNLLINDVLVTENSKSFSHFITNVCAIIGGVFTVAGILDSILHNTIRLVKKVELGKNF